MSLFSMSLCLSAALSTVRMLHKHRNGQAESSGNMRQAGKQASKQASKKSQSSPLNGLSHSCRSVCQNPSRCCPALHAPRLGAIIMAWGAMSRRPQGDTDELFVHIVAQYSSAAPNHSLVAKKGGGKARGSATASDFIRCMHLTDRHDSSDRPSSSDFSFCKGRSMSNSSTRALSARIHLLWQGASEKPM